MLNADFDKLNPAEWKKWCALHLAFRIQNLELECPILYFEPQIRMIHTVGPIWQGGNAGEPDLLASCYRESLSLALKHGIKTIAFPSISTGIYGYPTEHAAVVALNAVKSFLEGHDEITEVRFVLFDSATYRCYENAMAGMRA